MKALMELLKRAHEDEQGAEGLEKVLILAAVALPLLAVLIFYRNEIKEWIDGKAEDVIDAEGDLDPTDVPDF